MVLRREYGRKECKAVLLIQSLPRTSLPFTCVSSAKAWIIAAPCQTRQSVSLQAIRTLASCDFLLCRDSPPSAASCARNDLPPSLPLSRPPSLPPRSSAGVQRIFDIKGRAGNKPLAIACSSIADVTTVADVSHLPSALLPSLLPGAVTLLLPVGERRGCCFIAAARR